MKKFLSFLLLTYVFTLSGQIPSSLNSFAEEDLQTIFEKDYLNADDTLDMLHLQALQVLEQNNSSLSPEQLIQEFKAAVSTPEIQQRYLSIYASHFKPKEAKRVSHLMQNELYVPYRQQMGAANFQCHLVTRDVLQGLVQRQPIRTASKKESEDILHLNETNRREILNSEQPIVIDVYTEWCGPCKRLAPIIDELNQECGHLYHFVKLNAEQEKRLAKDFDIRSFPTILLIKEGREVGRMKGYMSKKVLLERIQQHLD